MEQLLERVMKAPPLHRYGGLAAVVLLTFVLNYFLFIQGIEDQIKVQQQRISQLTNELADKRYIAQNLNEYKRKMDLLETQLQAALTELPMRRDIEELLAQLNDIGRKAGLEIAKVEPGGESSQQFFASIPIKMAVAGNYHEIAMFLQEVANMRRIVNVNNIKLSDPTVKNDKVRLKSEFLATTFRFLDQSRAAQNPAGKK